MPPCVARPHNAPTDAPIRERPVKRLLSRIGLALAALLWLGAPTGATSLGTAPDDFARELAALVNQYRQSQGLAPLQPSAGLGEIAWQHTVAMVGQQQLTHVGFQERYRQTGSRICVENLARNFQTPEAVLRGWQLSPSHDHNLLEPKVSRMGIAVSARYVTFFACL